MSDYSSPYPREMDTGRIAVPFAVMTDIATVDCNVESIEVQNSTAGTITLTIQDKQTSAKKLWDAVAVDSGQIFEVRYEGDGRCSKGVSWQASATGLVGRLYGHKLTGWTAASSGTAPPAVPLT